VNKYSNGFQQRILGYEGLLPNFLVNINDFFIFLFNKNSGCVFTAEFCHYSLKLYIFIEVSRDSEQLFIKT
jgi:hypothetical protein